jgi:hypothetical protein
LPNKNIKIKLLPNYIRKNNNKKIHKSCPKFVFLTKLFKEKNMHYIPEIFLYAMIMNIEIKNIIDIIEISKSMEPNKCIKKNCMKMFI